MTECDRIAEQLDKALRGSPWHGGPCLRDLFTTIEARVAIARIVPNAHSIWEIALHLAATQENLIRRIGGDASTLHGSEEDEWPCVGEETPEAWDVLCNQLSAQDQALQQCIREYPSELLNEPLVEGGSSAYNTFHGYLQHNAWHGGQVVLLLKIAKASTNIN